MSVAPEHVAFEAIPAAVTVVQGDVIVYANRAALALFGAGELVGASTRETSRRLRPTEQGWVNQLTDARLAGHEPTDRLWLTYAHPNGSEIRLRVLNAPGPREGEHTQLYFEERPENLAVRQLTDALVAASWNLVHRRDEASVLEAAADALAEHAFRVIILRSDGERFFHALIRYDQAHVAEMERRAGLPMSAMALPREQAAEFAQCLEERRALFIQDTHAMVDRFRPPDVAAVIKASMPRRSAVAPIFVEGRGWGVLTAQKDDLTPAMVGAIELFAHRIGGALENVAHLHRAQARVEELNALQGKLVVQERLAVLGEAAAVLSHEMRNPIAAILNAVTVLGRRDPTQTDEVLRIIEEESLRLDHLVRDLLHLARPLQPKMVPLELDAVAERAIATVRGRVSTQVPMEVVRERPASALGDAFLLELAVENLLVNALRVSPAHGKVQVRVSGDGERARIAVDDMGPGVAPEIAPKLFEPFFTTHATGTGLGLAVVRKVVDAHSGEVRALQSPLGGARFEIALRNA